MMMMMAMLMTMLSIAFAGSSIPNNNNHRQLVWAEEEWECSEETMANMQADYSNVDIRTCYQSRVQWDPDAVLVADFLILTGYFFTDSGLTVDLTKPYIDGAHFPKHISGGACQSFVDCLNAESGKVLIGHYAYDCSNVYCGPNAIRNCKGETQTVPCTDGLVSLPEIPSKELVACLKERASRSEDEGCSDCEVYEERSNVVSFQCTPRCLGCTTDGTCFERSTLYLYDHFLTAYSTCHATNSGSGDRIICIHLTLGPLHSTDVGYSFLTTNCRADLNGEACSCSICGLDDGLHPLVTLDCSNVAAAAAAENSVFDECSQTFTGVFQGLGQELEFSCATTTTSDNPPVSTSPAQDPPGMSESSNGSAENPQGAGGSNPESSGADPASAISTASIILAIMLTMVIMPM